jgi:DNA-binding PadR family transcriptional regulator
MLSKMKPDGYLSSTSTRHGRTSVKFYAITHHGLERLAVARILLNELKAEGRT